MIDRFSFVLFSLLSITLAVGQESDTKEPTSKAKEAFTMDNEKLGALIEKYGKDVQGRPGFWQFSVVDVKMLCVTDEAANRMRIITPISPISELTAGQLAQCMEANFDRALDARYCINGDTLWGAFIHPLSDLTPFLFEAAIIQVAGVKKNFGTTYSSGGLQFGGGSQETEPEETTDEERPDV